MLSLISSVNPSPTTNKLFLRLSAETKITKGKIRTFRTKSLPQLHSPATSKVIAWSLKKITYNCFS